MEKEVADVCERFMAQDLSPKELKKTLKHLRRARHTIYEAFEKSNKLMTVAKRSVETIKSKGAQGKLLNLLD